LAIDCSCCHGLYLSGIFNLLLSRAAYMQQKEERGLVMNAIRKRFVCNNKKGMELVQVAILVAIAIGLGILFREQIGTFVSVTFNNLNTTFGS